MSARSTRRASRPAPNVGTSRLVQFELYHRLRVAGVAVVPEYRIPTPHGACYADLAVVDRQGIAYALVECKARCRWLGRRQNAKYEATGRPYLVAGWETLDAATAWCVARRAEVPDVLV